MASGQRERRSRELEPGPRRTLTVDEVAPILGIGSHTIYRSIRSGDFPNDKEQY